MLYVNPVSLTIVLFQERLEQCESRSTQRQTLSAIPVLVMPWIN